MYLTSNTTVYTSIPLVLTSTEYTQALSTMLDFVRAIVVRSSST